MELVHIFSPENNPDEGLWALKYEQAAKDEFKKLFDNWFNPEWMHQFCINNLKDVEQKFDDDMIDAEAAADELMEEAEDLQELLYTLVMKGTTGMDLQALFKPLHNHETNLTVLQLSKGSIKNRFIRNPKLRIYAVRIGRNTYVVTGGAIKLTDRMDERPHTKEQRLRLIAVRDWLGSEGISYPEDLNNLL